MRLYPILSRLLMPLAGVWLRRRARHDPAWAFALEERFGNGPEAEVAPLWIHAASVGEVNSAAGLVSAIRARWPERALRLTAFTATGCARWKELARDMPHVHVAPMPLDHPVWVERALRRTGPVGIVIVETEIWPNFLLAAHAQAIPVLMVSARISARSVRGWERWIGRKLMHAALAPIIHVGAQSESDAAHFARLGATAIAVDGSLKWDAKSAQPQAAQVASVRRALHGRRCWLAASTHDGEDAILLDAHLRLQERYPGLCMLLAPRHPYRADAVQQLCEARGMAVVRRTSAQDPGAAPVWLIDTLGELTTFMAAAEVVFMGGSLVPVGGHNLLEPVACGTPVVTGTQPENAQEIAQALESAQAILRAGDAEAIAQAISGLLESPEAAQAQADRAAAVLQSGGGAVSRAIKVMASRLPL